MSSLLWLLMFALVGAAGYCLGRACSSRTHAPAPWFDRHGYFEENECGGRAAAVPPTGRAEIADVTAPEASPARHATRR